MLRQCRRQSVDDRKRLLLKPEHHNARGEIRWVTQDVGEVAVQADQDAGLMRGHRQKPIVGSAGQLLIARQRHIMTGGTKNGRDTVRHILVELDRGHGYADTGTMVSRERSAAYASAAAIASLGSVG